MSPTGYEVGMYRDITRIAQTLDAIHKELVGISLNLALVAGELQRANDRAKED